MYINRKLVGIFYKDEEWAKRRFKQIMKDMTANDRANIDKVEQALRPGRGGIYFRNGSWIRFFKADPEKLRGLRVDEAIVQGGIDEIFINKYIFPLTFPQVRREYFYWS